MLYFGYFKVLGKPSPRKWDTSNFTERLKPIDKTLVVLQADDFEKTLTELSLLYPYTGPKDLGEVKEEPKA